MKVNVLLLVESTMPDAMITDGRISPTICEAAGAGGGHVPIIMTENERAMEVRIYDARGNGQGGVAPTLTGDHQNRITDYTALVVSRTPGADGGTRERLRNASERPAEGTAPRRTSSPCGEERMSKVYPQKTGALCANSHPGSYTGQDAFNDMLPVVESYTGGGIAATLDASYYKGPGARNGKEREFIAIRKKVCTAEAHARRVPPSPGIP